MAFITPGVLVERGTELARLRDEFEKSVPFVAFEYVNVTFLAADTDLDIIHHIRTLDPEAVDYQVMRKDRVCDVYNDTSGTRRKWGKGFITLRCDTEGAIVTLLLTTRRI